MTRYTVTYQGHRVRGPFLFQTEAAIAAIFTDCPNPTALAIEAIEDDGSPLDPRAAHTTTLVVVLTQSELPK